MSVTEGLPAIDHHSHASAYASASGRYRTVREYEDHFSTGLLESRMPAADYRAFVVARNADDRATLAALDAAYDVEQTLAEARAFRSTMFFTTALKRGCADLYGTSDEARFDSLGDELRGRSFTAPYDAALEVANTPIVFADVKAIDRDAWNPAHYRQIIRIDPYLYPFGFRGTDDRGTERQRFLGIFEGVLADELDKHGLESVPTTLDDFVDFVLASLAARRADGAIGYKIVSAYVRTLQFTRVDRPTAAAAYESLARTDEGDRSVVSDYLATRIAEEAGEHGVPIQIHTGMGHPEPGMYVRNADPLNLEQFLIQPQLNRTKFVLIHGAYPFTSQAAAITQTYGNVHLDFSWMPYLHHTHLREKLVEWMEILPANKLIFGTDTGLPELHVAATAYAREAVDYALLGGRERGVWTTPQIEYLAQRVLFQNAADLYSISMNGVNA